MGNLKYTKELLEPIVKESFSFAEVMRKLGIKWSGGSQRNIKSRIIKHGLNIEHFTGKPKFPERVPHNKKSWKDILTFSNSSDRIKTILLRRALIEYGMEYKCAECGQGPIWHDKKLVLQINHKNSNWKDNQPDNLEFLCPNCHSTTPGWSNSKGQTNLVTCNLPKRKRCAKCNALITNISNCCKKCVEKKRKVEHRPNLDILLAEVNDFGYSGTGRKYGVSDKSIVKWIKRAKLETITEMDISV